MTESKHLIKTIFLCTYFSGMLIYGDSFKLCVSLYTQMQTQRVPWHLPGQDARTLVLCVHFSGVPIVGWESPVENFIIITSLEHQKHIKIGPCLSIIFPDNLCAKSDPEKLKRHAKLLLFFIRNKSQSKLHSYIFTHTHIHTTTSLCASQ